MRTASEGRPAWLAARGALRPAAAGWCAVAVAIATAAGAGCDAWQQGLWSQQAAFVHFRRAEVLERAARLPEAVAELREAVRLDPGDPGYRLKLAYLLLEQGAPQEALEHFLAAHDRDPEDLSAREGLVWSYLALGERPPAEAEARAVLERAPERHRVREALAGLLAARAEGLAEAVQHYRRLIEAEPERGRHHTALGRCLEALGQPQQALAHYRRAVEVDPAWDEGQVLLARARLKAGERQAAIDGLRAALRARPDRWALREELADIYAAEEASRELAVGEYRLVLDNTAPRAELHGKLARLLLAMGRSQEAVKHLRAAVALEPRHEELQFLLVETLRELGQNAEAIEALRTYQRLAGDSYAVAVNLGYLHLHSEEPRAAEAAFRRALELRPGDRAAEEGLAWALLHAGSPQAVAVAERVLQAQPELWPLRERLADVLAAEPRDRERAVEHYRFVLGAQPGQSRIRVKLARALLALGRHGEAVGELRRAVEADPAQAEAQFLLAEALKRSGQLQEAIAVLRRYRAAVPSHPGAAVALGYLLLERGQVKEALDEFRAALALEPEAHDALEGMGWALLAAGDKAGAAATIARVLEQRPDDRALRRALLYLLAERPEELDRAIAECRRLLAAAPADTELWRQLLDMLWAKHDFDTFQRDAARLLALAPQDWLTRMRLAELSRKRGDVRGAIEQYQAILQTASDDKKAATWTALGYLHLDEGRLEQATGAFESALAVDPDQLYLPAVEGLAWTYVKRGEHQRAIEYLEQLVARYPQRLRFRETLADLLAQQAETAGRAAAEYQRLVEAEPGEVRYRRKYIAALARAGRLVEAADKGELALGVFPQDRELRQVVLDVLLQAKEIERASRIYRQLLQDDPYDVERRLIFSYQLFEAGRLHEAIEQFSAIVRLQPEERRAREGLLWCYLKLDNRVAALGELRLLLDGDPANRELHLIYADLLAADPSTVDQASREYERILKGLPYDRTADATRTADRRDPRAAGVPGDRSR
ncbi:MAG: hypothetical protein KatS3mg102_1896 [Planctomycetota bacterium]|nr:MAG: hypothetical protein KatS3mg102_1896 [Planctomycetota bacterium]